MIKSKSIIICCLIILTAFVDVFSQEENFVPNFTPPSPNAYELGKYGQIPVGLFTGSPNINIPLYEYKTRNLSVPISLSYNSTGIKVDQIESNVGLGWSLNAGGVISKIVRDKPDEISHTFFPKEEVSNFQDPLTIEYFHAIGEGGVDSETDLFMFNFQGHSGKFVYDKNKKIVLIPHQELKVEPYDDGTNSGYQITTSDGVKYLFTSIERTRNTHSGGHPEEQYVVTAWYLSKITHPKGDEIYFTYSGQSYYYTSVSQTLEVLMPGAQTCDGSYYNQAPIRKNHTTTTRIQGLVLTGISSNNPFNGQVELTPGFTNTKITNYNLISSISIKNNELQEIEKFDFQYIRTSRKRIYLQKVTFKDVSKFYEFEYNDPEQFPERDPENPPYHQDHWGYCNGKSNAVLTPKLSNNLIFENLEGADMEPDFLFSSRGLLQKVTYPTKGYTQIEYESNTYYGDRTTPGHGAHIGLEACSTSDCISENHGYGSETLTLDIDFKQTVKVKVGVSFESGDGCTDAGKSRAVFSIVNVATGVRSPLYYYTGYGSSVLWDGTSFYEYTNSYNFFANLEPGSYIITLIAQHVCETAFADIYYLDSPPYVVKDNIETGGLRVKKTISHDPINNQSIIKRYYYAPMDKLNESSGDVGANPYYISNKVDGELCSIANINYKYYSVLSSSSLNSLFNTGNSNVYYKYVTISNGGDNFENGGEEHEFILNRDEPGDNIWGNDIREAPYTNFGWNHGLEKQTKIFKKDGSVFKVLQETTNDYVPDYRNYYEVFGYSVRKNYDMLATSDVTYTCTASDISKRHKDYYCSNTNHAHLWFLNPFGETICTALGANNTFRWINHPCYGQAEGHIITAPQNIENLDIVEYKNISWWSYLDNTITTQFDVNGGNPITTYTKYYYDNPEHIQVSRVETSNEKGEKIMNKTYYPDDDLASLGFIAEQVSLIGQLGKNGLYNISESVQTEQWVNDKKTMTTRTLYKNWGNGSNLILPEIVQMAVGSGSLEPKLRFYNYDAKGNPLEVSKENDVSSIYYWGYNERYLVAKFENMPYSIINNTTNGLKTELDKLDNKHTLTNSSDRGLLKTINSNIREKIPADALANTYTYTPMIGLTSQTDPNNKTSYYHYDGFGRLASIKDDENQFLKTINYHYTNLTGYTVTFNSIGGSTVPSTMAIFATIKAPIQPTRPGYIFGGWYKESSCTNAWNFDNDKITSDITLYAKWTAIIYNISFNSQGGSPVSGTTATYNEMIAPPTNPTRTGYTFLGWYKEPSCVNIWNFYYHVVTGNTTLYAKWSRNEYTVTVTQIGSGTISPSGNLTLYYGESKTFTFTPSENYIIKDVKIDGSSKGAISSSTFSNINANHTIVVEFGIILSVDKNSISYLGEGGAEYFQISSCLSWTITKPTWITLSASSGTGSASIRARASTSGYHEREGDIEIRAGGKLHKIHVIQYAVEIEKPIRD